MEYNSLTVGEQSLLTTPPCGNDPTSCGPIAVDNLFGPGIVDWFGACCGVVRSWAPVTVLLCSTETSEIVCCHNC